MDKTTKLTDDELLSAYIDNELTPEQADTLAERLAAEPPLMRRYEAMRGGDAAVREAFRQVDETPMPASVLDAIERSRATAPADNVVRLPVRGVRRFFEMPVAIAASVALVAGFIGASLFRPTGPLPYEADMLAAGNVPTESGLYDLLESTPGGESVDIAGGSAEVLLTFEDVNGDWCRQLRVAATDRSVHGIACRRGTGWQLETISLGDAGAPGGQYGAASSDTPAAVDTAVDSLIGDGIPVEIDEENSLISTGWKKSAD